jgi:hypothetical protein
MRFKKTDNACPIGVRVGTGDTLAFLAKEYDLLSTNNTTGEIMFHAI